AWFSAEAEQRRRAAAAAQDDLSRRAAGDIPASGATVWQSSELFVCVALAAGLLIAGPTLNAASVNPCRTDPALLIPASDLDVKMTVSHNAACAIWAKADNMAVSDLTITLPPQHGRVKMRGRTGVIYIPAPGFAGPDQFAFTL